jgi:hypothetical protein
MRRDSFIHVIPGALSPEFCQNVIARFEADPRKYAGRTGSLSQYRPELRQATDLYISKLPEWKDVDHRIFLELAAAINEYQNNYPILSSFRLKDRGYMVQRTMPGEKYDWHSDVDDARNATRQFIAFWYLNTVQEGGETEFLEQEVTIKPTEGTLVLFPAAWTHVHRGRPPISNPKYTLISWICFCDP